ncbi:MAG: hypothetical protein R3293_24445 [Candidatus Promineifilaceae bacterium]|nr:hypothetical protein [Candidatus Promineifilaceae bacterium]
MKWHTARVIAGIIFLSTASWLFAHGGGDLIAGPVLVGPYTVSVWLNPPDPRIGEPIHYTVGVAAPADGQPVLDTQIWVEMRILSDGSLITSAPATTDQSVNRLFYETDMKVEEPGLYATTFHIVGPAGEGDLVVDVEVGSQARINWLFPGLFGILIIVVFGWWRSRRGE